jgi:parallel beta-helix repeat protein
MFHGFQLGPLTPLLGQEALVDMQCETAIRDRSPGLMSLLTSWPCRVGLALLLALAFATPAEATTWYVRKTGNDMNDGQSAAQALLTINKAATFVNPGDTVYVGAGTYGEWVVINRGGTSGAIVSFIGDTSGQYMGDAGNVIVSGESVRARCIDVNNCSYVLLKGFQLTKATWDGLDADTNVSNLTVEDCQAYTNCEAGFDFAGNNCVVRRCVAYSNDEDGIAPEGGTGIIISECITYSNDGDGIHIKGGSATVTNCVAYSNGQGIHISSSSGVVVVNNTVVDNSQDDIDMNDQSNLTVVNNIISDNGDNGLDEPGSSSTCDYNLLYDNSGGNYDGVSPGAHDIVANPLFKDPASRDYHLTASSPARNAGATAGAPTIDYENYTRRSSDGFVDIGADEYGRRIRVLSWRQIER